MLRHSCCSIFFSVTFYLLGGGYTLPTFNSYKVLHRLVIGRLKYDETVVERRCCRIRSAHPGMCTVDYHLHVSPFFLYHTKFLFLVRNKNYAIFTHTHLHYTLQAITALWAVMA